MNICRKKWLGIILIIIIQFMLSLNLKSASGVNIPSFPDMMGDYDMVIRGTNGHVDTATMISRLQNANIKTYMYLIYGSYSVQDWNDFCNEFMPAAQDAGIDIYVYLVPPSEGGPSLPYDENNGGYVAWAEAIADQADSYSHLKGLVMDDFSCNLTYFTPSFLDTIMDAAHDICPRLSLWVIVYFFSEDHQQIIHGKFFPDYADHIDGVIFPYRDLDYTTNLDNEIVSVKEMIENYMTGYYSFAYPYSTSSVAGDYARISQTVNVVPGQSEYRIGFYHFGDYTYVTQGYHIKRLLIDNTVVWSADVAATGSQSGTVDLNVTSYLAGKTSAVLSFELYEQQGVSNYCVGFNLKNLTATNVSVHDFSETSYWNYTTNNTYFSGIYTAFNPTNGTIDLPLSIMIYTQPTTWHSAPPTTEYITQALNIAGEAVKAGNADGFVTYVLDKTNVIGANYLAAKAVFFNYRDYFYCKGGWKFDEGIGNIAYDNSIFANDGTLVNVSWDNYDSKSGCSLSFNGTNYNRVDIANDASLQLTGDLTLSLWVKPDNLNNRQNLLHKCYYGEFALTLETNGSLSYYHGSSGSNYYGLYALPAGTIKADGSWQHIAITRDTASRTIRSYYNGNLQGAWTYPADELPTVSTANVYIGYGYTGIPFAGKIDSPAIYDRPLSQGEVYRQYLDDDSNGNWKFDESYGTSASDDSFFANDGTLVNVSWDNYDSKSGCSLSFNGTNYNRVDIANDASLQLTGDLTLSLWVKPDNLNGRKNLLHKCYYGEFALTLEPNGSLTYYHGSSTSNYYGLYALPAGTIKADGSWQHIVITRDTATRTVKSYYNGSLQGSWTYPVDKLPTASTANVYIGYGYTGIPFAGKIDEVRILKRGLSDSEVNSLYNSY